MFIIVNIVGSNKTYKKASYLVFNLCVGGLEKKNETNMST